MGQILGWIKDGLGINRYHVAWRYEFGGLPGKYHEGNTGEFFRSMPRSVAESVAASMSQDYGPGTHWVVKESTH